MIRLTGTNGTEIYINPDKIISFNEDDKDVFADPRDTGTTMQSRSSGGDGGMTCPSCGSKIRMRKNNGRCRKCGAHVKVLEG